MKDAGVVSVHTTEIGESKDVDQNLSADSASHYLPATEWPVRPTPLLANRRSLLYANLYDTALSLLSVCLLVKVGLVIAAWYLDRGHRFNGVDQATPLTQYLIRFNGQLVTLFTILFGLVIGTLVRRYALWKAQTGAYVHELEQLQGSTSLPSALKLIYSLRAWSGTSVALALVWAFSYLGSQASKEEYQFVTSGPAGYHDIAVPAAECPGLFDIFQYNQSAIYSPLSPQDTMTAFFADFFTAVRKQHGATSRDGVDQYGNVIVPDINMLEAWLDDESLIKRFPAKTVSRAGDNWVKLDSLSALSDSAIYTDDGEVWTSSYGIPLYLCDSSGSSSQMIGKYTLSTGYLTFGCEPPAVHPYTAFPNGTTDDAIISLNMTDMSSVAPNDLYGKPLRTIELWNRWTESQSSDAVSNGSAVSICNVTSINVEVNVVCDVSGCSPKAIRYLKGMTTQQATNYSTPFDDDTFASLFLGNFSSQSLVGSYIGKWGSQVFSNYPDSSDSRTELFSSTIPHLLRNLVNTFYLASQQAQGYQPNVTEIINTGTDGSWVKESFYGSEYMPRYAISWPWIAIDFVSCAIMCAATIVSHRLRLMTLVPDILGYVSSLTRDNPNFKGPLPDNGTGLDGISRARMMRSIKVQIGDVSGSSTGIARIGLAVVDVTNPAAGPGNFERVEHVRVETLRRDMSVV